MSITITHPTTGRPVPVYYPLPTIQGNVRTNTWIPSNHPKELDSLFELKGFLDQTINNNNLTNNC